MCNAKCWLIAGSVIGGLLAILGGILIPVGDIVISSEIDKEAVIEEGTIAYENWVDTGSPVYRQFWIYHVTNPDAVLNASMPILEQKGPYTYLVRYLSKVNITQNQNDTVSFEQPNSAIFQPSMSIGSDNDTYTVLNLAVAAAPSLYPLLLSIVNILIKTSNSSLFQVRSVKDILWGYPDPLLQQIPGVKDATTGVFYPYEGTADGVYNVFNGKNNISKVALIDRYKGESSLGFWNDNYCDMLNGTDAASFPPYVKKNKDLYFFSSEICRSIYGTFEKEYTLKGIKLYRFVLPKFALASPTVNPDNMCYCKDTYLSRNCTAAGILDLRVCQGGKPIFLTLPHYLYASDFLLESVEGLKPNIEEHQTYLDVEPLTGFTMHFAKRLQVNVMFRQTDKIDVLSNLRSDFLFPVLWLNETATISDESANTFKSAVTSRTTALGIVQIVFICVGIVVFLACSITLCVRGSKKRKG
ncbi:platelet glycoprotein 4 [Discoglossus pictus]